MGFSHSSMAQPTETLHPSARGSFQSRFQFMIVSAPFWSVPRRLKKPERRLTATANQEIKCLGLFMARLSWKRKIADKHVCVLPSQGSPVIGFPTITALGAVEFIDAMEVPHIKTSHRTPLKNKIFKVWHN